MKKKRVIAAFLTILILLAILLTAFVTAAEASHDCEGEGCRVCETMSMLNNILHGSSAAALLFTIVCLLIGQRAIKENVLLRFFETPVTEKVRLLN